jgi:SpoU rRNA methylase family enzyme
MIIKCRECDEPMSESRKGRPDKLPENVKWIVCRQCEKGVEVVDSADTTATTDTPAKVMNFEEEVMTKIYVTLKQTKEGVTKYRYSDPQRKVLIGEEKVG